MLTAISAYLFGDATEESVLETDAISESDDVVEDWVFVNHANVQGKSSPETADSQAKMAESWFVTPPSCFDNQTKRGKKHPKVSNLENLLIEHPSMSVYAPNSQPENNADESGGSSPKKTAVGPIVNSKQDNHRLQQGRIFLNPPANKRVPLKDLACNSKNALAMSFSRKGSKRSNQVHSRYLTGRQGKKESRKNGKHVGMVSKRAK